MRYLLDSDTLSDLYEPASPGHTGVARRLAQLSDADKVFISILALYEVEYGYANAPEGKKALIRQRIADMRGDFEILPLTPEAARLFGSLKAALSQFRGLSNEKSKIHNIDVMLAATAVTESCTLISADSIYGDLQKADPMLQIENWLV
jgi:predicted nucleic acid-binding protein